jgi:hypothetical protein
MAFSGGNPLQSVHLKSGESMLARTFHDRAGFSIVLGGGEVNWGSTAAQADGKVEGRP